MLPTIDWHDGGVVMIDQRKLPVAEVYVTCRTAAQVARAIKSMVIRGAPAIGVAAAMGLALGLRSSKATGTQRLAVEFYKCCEMMSQTRPTAVNLFWAIERMKKAFAAAASAGQSVGQIADRLESEARAIHDEDIASCRAMGKHGATLVPASACVLCIATPERSRRLATHRPWRDSGGRRSGQDGCGPGRRDAPRSCREPG